MNAKETTERVYKCGFEFTLDMISGRWKGLILWYLGFGTLRYNELRKILKPITQKMLTQSLRELESDGLIIRTVYPVVPPKVEYTLTEEGEKLIPLFKMLQEWGTRVADERGVMTECALKALEKQ